MEHSILIVLRRISMYGYIPIHARGIYTYPFEYSTLYIVKSRDSGARDKRLRDEPAILIHNS